MQINLALERVRTVTTDFDPRKILDRFILRINGLEFEVKDEKDVPSFNAFLASNPDLRQSILEAVQSGMRPQQAMQLAIQMVRSAGGAPGAAHAAVMAPATLESAIDAFAGSRETLAGNRRSTAGEKRRTMDLLLDFLGRGGRDTKSMLVHELSRAHLIDFVEHHAKRSGKVKGAATPGDSDLTIKVNNSKKRAGAIPAEDRKAKPDTLAAGTVIKAVGHLRNFCIYATGKQMMVQSPVDDAFMGAIAGISKKAQSEKQGNNYGIFTAAHLRRIFEPTDYLRHNSAADAFWIPLAGALSVARLGELAGLCVEDIQQDVASGLHVFEFGERDAKGVKNKNSVRRVPVAERLVELGFLNYVDRVRYLGAKSLFPHRPSNATRESDPGKIPGQNFGLYLDRIGLSDSNLVYHSFRHTTITKMHVDGVPVMDTELIAGHASQDLERASDAARSHGSKPWESVHRRVYIHADQYERNGQALMARLKGHIDRSLDFDLDYAGLQRAARIVLDHVVINGETGKFKSGWHTNAKRHSEAQLALLKR